MSDARLIREFMGLCTEMRDALQAIRVALTASPGGRPARPRRRPMATTKRIPTSPLDDELFLALKKEARRIRFSYAKRLGWPQPSPYAPVSKRDVEYMARALPTDTDELIRLPNWGPKKAAEYGPKLLPLVVAFCRREGMLSEDDKEGS